MKERDGVQGVNVGLEVRKVIGEVGEAMEIDDAIVINADNIGG